MASRVPPTRERLLSLSVIDEHGCWIWQRRVCRGYGYLDVACKAKLAHRLAYEEFVGPIPEGMTLDHLCRVSRCINPAHLEPVTLRENIRRGGNAIKTHCKRGHSLADAYVHPKGGNRSCETCRRLRQRGALV